MATRKISFDEVFKIWMDAEIATIEGRDLLALAKAKGFNSVVEWRLATALRLGMDTREWALEDISRPNETLPNIIIGPYQGWSRFFKNDLTTTFAQALNIPDFFEWCSAHDRIVPISQNFPIPTKLILFRKPTGELIHIEGGHRISAVAYRMKLGRPIDFGQSPAITAAIADISNDEIHKLTEFLTRGTSK